MRGCIWSYIINIGPIIETCFKNCFLLFAYGRWKYADDSEGMGGGFEGEEGEEGGEKGMLFWKMLWERRRGLWCWYDCIFWHSKQFLKYDKTCFTCEHLNLNIKNISAVFNNVNMKLWNVTLIEMIIRLTTESEILWILFWNGIQQETFLEQLRVEKSACWKVFKWHDSNEFSEIGRYYISEFTYAFQENLPYRSMRGCIWSYINNIRPIIEICFKNCFLLFADGR